MGRAMGRPREGAVRLSGLRHLSRIGLWDERLRGARPWKRRSLRPPSVSFIGDSARGTELMSRWWGQAVNRLGKEVRGLAPAIWDALSWIVAVPLAMLLRYDSAPPANSITLGLVGGVLAGLAQLVIGLVTRVYRGRYVVGTIDDVRAVVSIGVVIGFLGTGVLLITRPLDFPRTVLIIAMVFAIMSMLGARLLWRGFRRQSALHRKGTRTLIYGAGDAGSQIATLLLESSGDFQPVGFLDDDPARRHLRRNGLRVLGNGRDLESIIDRYAVDTLLVAWAGVTSAQLLEIDRRCRALGVSVRIIPTASEIAGGAVRLGDISDLTDEDLLGRQPVKTDEEAIRNFIEGRRVLITGAGGSIGSELARQVARYRPSRLALLDRDESALHAVQLSLDGTGSLTSEDLLLADIRDPEALRACFSDVKPEIVFHAAALKHLPFLERFPREAWLTNIRGTQHVLDAARQVGVDAFVNISTDKAADPTSVLGYSKRITERLTAGQAKDTTGRYVSVRFGNVLGSRGSVLQTFRFQIAAGGPVTVTDEGVTRYFMTVREAVHLVLQASVIGESGETLILDMGTPVPIVEVARQMIARSGRDIPIVFTGLRAGEKLDEVLIDPSEVTEHRVHPLIAHTRVMPLDPHTTILTTSADPNMMRVLAEQVTR